MIIMMIILTKNKSLKFKNIIMTQLNFLVNFYPQKNFFFVFTKMSLHF